MEKSEKRDFNKKLIALVIPISFQQLMLALVSASDALMLGAVGQSELSAVSLAGQVQFVLSLFFAAITIGMSTLMAQYKGKGDYVSVEKIFAIAAKITVPICLIFTLLTLFIPEIIMKIFTSDTELVKKGAEYLRYASISYFFTGISQIYVTVMKNCSQARAATLINSVIVVFDIFMNAVFIFGLFGCPQLGIKGAAISTSIARVVEAVAVILGLRVAKRVRLRWKYLRYTDKELFRAYKKYTLPVMCNEIVWGVGFTAYSVIMGHLGSDATSANAIANVTKNIAICFCLGVGSGGGIMVGNELGAGNIKRAEEYGKRLTALAVISGAVSGVIVMAASPLILELTTLNAEATQYLKYMLIISGVYMIGKSVNCTTIGGIFCAGGDTKFGFICDSIVMWGIVVPLGSILAFVFKVPIIWVYLFLSLDEFIKIPAVIVNYKKYKWVKNLTRKESL